MARVEHFGGAMNGAESGAQRDLADLRKGDVLAGRYRAQKKLGGSASERDGFASYLVFDERGDVERVVKLAPGAVKASRASLTRRFDELLGLPPRPGVARVLAAGFLDNPRQTPYMVYERVEGLNVAELIEDGALSLDDAARVARDVATALGFLHARGVCHGNVKPSNLLWTDQGVWLADFFLGDVNETFRGKAQGPAGAAGPQWGWLLPPAWNGRAGHDAADKVDRDLFALGIAVYRCATGRDPFAGRAPSLNSRIADPRAFPKGAGLSPGAAAFLLKAIDPDRSRRFACAEDFLAALDAAGDWAAPSAGGGASSPNSGEDGQPNNAFVSYLLTLYSQSEVSNAGTRGYDGEDESIYAPTDLDKRLAPDLLAGAFRLVIISGNAGDGKTAFIQRFEKMAVARGARERRFPNGAEIRFNGWSCRSNYDGSQDEGEVRNDEALARFFGPFAGADPSSWPTRQTRLIAINEGRLVDFFLSRETEFPLLSRLALEGLGGAAPKDGVAVVNLNLRSVVSNGAEPGDSILERTLSRMTEPKRWQVCERCALKDRCYALHNAKTFQDPAAGPRVMARLKALYAVTHLRGRLHITMRDLRSALSFMLVGTRGCAEIRKLCQDEAKGDAQAGRDVLDGFYFNSWLGGAAGSKDRLVSLLREIDVAEVSNPDLDRALGFFDPEAKRAARFSFPSRGGCDDKLLKKMFDALPRDYASGARESMVAAHREFLASMRRRHYFECRDSRSVRPWEKMLPYRSFRAFLDAVEGSGRKGSDQVAAILTAINKGEGLVDPKRLGARLAVRVRSVPKGSIRSYRVFGAERFSLSAEPRAASRRYIEFMPQALALRYDSGDGRRAKLRVTLDVYEMLMRLNDGYLPNIEERQGFYISLAVFKNMLSAAPYQEALLTEDGLAFFRLWRDGRGVLHLRRLGDEGKA